MIWICLQGHWCQGRILAKHDNGIDVDVIVSSTVYTVPCWQVCYSRPLTSCQKVTLVRGLALDIVSKVTLVRGLTLDTMIGNRYHDQGL